jgi:Uma2 family endonuclease
MSLTLSNRKFTVEEYFIYEESNEIRHEFISGNLYEMSGASREHHQICKRLLFFFEKLLAAAGYEIFIENMKVKIPGENIFFYPDIIVTHEPQTNQNRYAQYEPELLVEVTSEKTRTKDMIDKFLQYQKFSSLKYYLIAEQDKPEIIVVGKNENGNWQSETYSGTDAVINLPFLNFVLHLNEIYLSNS